MRASKRARQQQNMQKRFGPFVQDESVVMVMTMEPEVKVPEAKQLNVALAVGGALGVAAHARRGVRDRDASLRATSSATTSAGRFPRVATTLIVTATRLVATDVHYVTGRSSMVMASYDLTDIAFLTQMRRKGVAVLEFQDESEVTLRAVSGTAKHAQKFLDLFEAHLAGEHIDPF